MSLPAQIKGLMRNTIIWEGYLGQDGLSTEMYAEPREVKCWMEEKGGTGGIQRAQSAGGNTQMDPKIDCYFDGDDPDAQTFTMRDRFTYTLNGQTWTTQADRVSIDYGPDSSNWLITVTL